MNGPALIVSVTDEVDDTLTITADNCSPAALAFHARDDLGGPAGSVLVSYADVRRLRDALTAWLDSVTAAVADGTVPS